MKKSKGPKRKKLQRIQEMAKKMSTKTHRARARVAEWREMIPVLLESRARQNDGAPEEIPERCGVTRQRIEGAEWGKTFKKEMIH